jgi:probable nitrogen fixation protein
MEKSIFIECLIAQVRALDTYDSWARKSNEEILKLKYIKTKEELKEIPIIADIDDVQKQYIRLIFQALAIAFEKKTGVMCSVIMELNHEGFGRAVVIADEIVVVSKFLKDAHRYSFRSYEKLEQEGEKMLSKAIEIYNSFKG